MNVPKHMLELIWVCYLWLCNFRKNKVKSSKVKVKVVTRRDMAKTA